MHVVGELDVMRRTVARLTAFVRIAIDLRLGGDAQASSGTERDAEERVMG